MRKVLSLFLLVAPAVSQTAPEEPTLDLGIQQVNDGNFQAAVSTLDRLIRNLTPQAATRAKELSQAHLFTGVAYVGLAQEEAAKAAFKEALKYDKDLMLSEKAFPPRVVRVFEAARKGKSKSVLYAGGGIGLGAVIAGVAVAAGGAAAKATTAQPTPPPPPPSVQIAFVGSTPPPGSTIRVNRDGNLSPSSLVMRFGVTVSRPVAGCTMEVKLFRGGQTCFSTTIAGFSVENTLTVETRGSFVGFCPETDLASTVLACTSPPNVAARATFNIAYRFRF